MDELNKPLHCENKEEVNNNVENANNIANNLANNVVVEKEYIISTNDINIISNQFDIDTEDIKTLLMKHRGDLYKVADDAYTVYSGNRAVLYENPIYAIEKNNNTMGVEDENDPKIKLEKFNYIIAEKNRIYNNYIKHKYDATSEVYYYIKLPMHTTAIIKEKINIKFNELVEKFVRNYLEDELPLKIYKSYEILTFKINNEDFISKWGLIDSVICFMSSQIKNTTDINGEQYIKYKNKFATRILKPILKENEIVIGSTIIIYNWKK